MTENESLLYLLDIIKQKDDAVSKVERYLHDFHNIEVEYEQLHKTYESLLDDNRTKQLEIEGLQHQLEELKAEINFRESLYSSDTGNNDDCSSCDSSGEELAKSYIDDYENAPESGPIVSEIHDIT